MWLSLTPKDITAVDYMSFSLFGLHGLQHKRGENLNHLVVPFNRLLELPLKKQESPFPIQDKVVFLVRNLFRVLLSRQNSVRKRGKTKWAITDEVFYKSVNAHYMNIEKYHALMAKHPGRFYILGHEVFCARPRDVFREMNEWLEIGNGTWNSSQDFFVECLNGKSAPVVRGDQLWDSTVERPILGTGGGYNPRTEPSLDRTLSDDVERFVKKEWMEYAQRLFGRRLAELWLSDTPATYESMSTEEYARLLYRL